MSLSAPIREAFEVQAEACRRMGSPFTALVCEALIAVADETSRCGTKLCSWTGNPEADVLALRAAGGLNFLVRSGLAPDLALLYPPNPLPLTQDLAAAILATVLEHDSFLAAFLDSPPQTNEVGRSAAILGGSLNIAQTFGLPLEIYEIGSSAGLNLAFDRFRYRLGDARWGSADAVLEIACDWRGPLPPLDAPLRVTHRSGCDRRPIDPASHDERERLLSYIWPDQIERVERAWRALEFAAASPWRVETADAGEWVERQFAVGSPSAAKVLLHTVVWQYLDDGTKSRITSAIESAGARATADSPIAWLRMEYDGGNSGAGLHLTTWPSGESQLLARADFHGRWIEWQNS